MKIKVKNLTYSEVLALPGEKPVKVKRPSRFFRALINVICAGELKRLHFRFTKVNMERFNKKQPCLYLMNHSSFLDLKIAERIFPQRFNIVCTSDAFVGQKWLLTQLGCIPTTKFVTDTTLVRHMKHCFDKLHTSVLMFPEASYSFDGTATTLPYGLGKFIKMFKVPVVMVTTFGDFLYDPLYNGLQQRKVEVSAIMEYMLTPEQIVEMSVEQINEEVHKRFSFDNFRYQQDNDIVIDEDFRADHLQRVLYKCPHCNTEGQMEGKGIHVTCHSCNKTYELTEHGFMRAVNGETEIAHIPSWYNWQRQCVRKEIEAGQYRLDTDVDVIVMKGTKAVYNIGSGHLTHDVTGFHLTAAEGELDYFQPASVSYSLYADYLWYEIGDVICIGNNAMLYYCFPKDSSVSVAKARLATEEIFRHIKKK
ncbi:MAG: 1-acyl-sn-glycerol-3-phosphate acyltransferase [Clostridiales bacterium]|nr:1-acyl-sn-glycerol-3-phosphate acyltransferase [Clostridiales bacterium]